MMKRLTCLVALTAALPVFAGSLIVTSEESAPKVAGIETAAAVQAAAPVVATGPVLKTWRVQNDDVRLSATIERWAKESGHRLIWDAQKQVLLSAGDSFTGTLEDALTRALSSPAIRKSDYPLEACFYPNNPPVIRVTRLGEQIEECPQ